MWRTNIAKFREIKNIDYSGHKKDFLGVEELNEYVSLSPYTQVWRQYSTYASRRYDINAATLGIPFEESASQSPPW